MLISCGETHCAQTRIAKCARVLEIALGGQNVPVPTPARPGSGSKGFHVAEYARPVVSQPPTGLPLETGTVFGQPTGRVKAVGLRTARLERRTRKLSPPPCRRCCCAGRVRQRRPA